MLRTYLTAIWNTFIYFNILYYNQLGPALFYYYNSLPLPSKKSAKNSIGFSGIYLHISINPSVRNGTTLSAKYYLLIIKILLPQWLRSSI